MQPSVLPFKDPISVMEVAEHSIYVRVGLDVA